MEGFFFDVTAQGGDQTSNIWISRLAGFPGHTGLPFTSVNSGSNCLTPVKTCWKDTGTPGKTCEHFGSRKSLKSDLLRLWTRISDMGWHNIVSFIGLFCKRDISFWQS